MSIIILAGTGVDPTHQDRIPLHARDGWEIQNLQLQKLPPDAIQQAKLIRDEFVTGTARLLNGPSGWYNCAGLTLASRRTQINDLDCIPRLLERDGFIDILEKDADTGDVVAYAIGGKVEHLGFVIAPAKHPDRVTPRVISKLGNAVEIEHDAHSLVSYTGHDRQYFRIGNEDLGDDDDVDG